MMKRALLTVTIGTITFVGLLAYLGSGGPAAAAKDEPHAKPGAGLTVYMDISVVGRKHGAAEHMTQLHAEHLEKGWMVVDMEPYIENGDLQGFFITYTGRD